MKKKLSQSIGNIGYGAIFFALALGFVVLFFLPNLKLSPNNSISSNNNCYIKNPDPKNNITYNGKTYVELRKNTFVLVKEVQTHLQHTGGNDNPARIKDAKGTERDSYSPTEELTKSVMWNGEFQVPTPDDMLLLDMSPPDFKSEFYLIDIYINKDIPIPPFIIKFCTENPDLGGYPLFRDQDGSSYPPLTLETKDIVDLKPPSRIDCSKFECLFSQNKKYYLINYEKFTGRVSIDPTGASGYVSYGTIPVKKEGKTFMNPMNYVSNSAIKLIALFSPDGKWQFNYIPEEFVSGQKDIVSNLNENYKDQNWDDNSLQLRALRPVIIQPWGWWTPECKPAIYLYTPKKMQVNVKVTPKGHLTYTDPVYDQNAGWNVTAYPNGSLEWLASATGVNSKGELKTTNFYNYLYYESKIHDSEIKIPTDGFIVKYEDLNQFYLQTLPQLGLNEKEISDYITYWQKVLPKADFYQIGILSAENIAQIEPLNITPKPDKLLRVRLYYQPLSNTQALEINKTIRTPNLQNNFQRSGFSVVEWGGMVKQDLDHPFTCSM